MQPSAEVGRVRLKSVAINAALFCASLAFAALIIECGVRWYFLGTLSLGEARDPVLHWRPHATRGWVLAPGQSSQFATVDFVVQFSTDAAGHRSSGPASTPKSGEFRIAMFGDSFIDAQQIAWGEAAPELVENGLVDRGVSVANFGVSGYGTIQEYVTLLEEGARFRPNLVVVFVYIANDVHNNSSELSRELWGDEGVQYYGRPFAVRDAAGAFVESKPDVAKLDRHLATRSAAAGVESRARWRESSLAFSVVTLYRDSLAQEVFLPQLNPNVYLGVYLDAFVPSLYPGSRLDAQGYERAWGEAWEVSFAYLEKMAGLSRAMGADLVVVLVPDKVQVEAKYEKLVQQRWPGLRMDMDKPSKRLAHYCGEHGIRVLDLLDAFRQAEARGEGPLYFRLQDRHWNSAGHALAASAVVDYLDREQLVPKR